MAATSCWVCSRTSRPCLTSRAGSSASGQPGLLAAFRPGLGLPRGAAPPSRRAMAVFDPPPRPDRPGARRRGLDHRRGIERDGGCGVGGTQYPRRRGRDRLSSFPRRATYLPAARGSRTIAVPHVPRRRPVMPSRVVLLRDRPQARAGLPGQVAKRHSVMAWRGPALRAGK